MSQLGLKGKAVTPHPVDRGQFPFLVVGLRGADQLLGPDRRHRAAAGPGHAWQLQPRRHAELHGGDRARTSNRAMSMPCPSATPMSADHREDPGAAPEKPRRTDRPRHDRSDAERQRRRSGYGTVTSKPAANGLRTVLNFQRVGDDPLFRCRGISRPHARAGAEGKQKTAGK